MLGPSTLFRQNGEQNGPNVSIHFSQIGFLQTWQFPVVNSVRCLWQYLLTGASSCAAGVSASCDREIRRREPAGGEGDDGDGAEASAVGGDDAAGVAASIGCSPASLRMSSFTKAE
ncbi:MAG TPA: hypothetical protein VGY56_03660 [Verrucomicrobiae bacterium]|nr:hypothetical protein [Verrucomicrobiae bacterium]